MIPLPLCLPRLVRDHDLPYARQEPPNGTSCGQDAAIRMICAVRSATMMVGAWVLARGAVGTTEAPSGRRCTTQWA
ncbi:MULTISPECIES: hypothetical protein [unclassified Streptomyces]|uniref:hypothetical protein n=1 Tax=unclassified Streptomyces TaxID=2593676 RepID=UPI00115F925C|nr:MULTISPECIES: hypothetical protein [unclassified Streptomyces]